MHCPIKYKIVRGRWGRRTCLKIAGKTIQLKHCVASTDKNKYIRRDTLVCAYMRIIGTAARLSRDSLMNTWRRTQTLPPTLLLTCFYGTCVRGGNLNLKKVKKNIAVLLFFVQNELQIEKLKENYLYSYFCISILKFTTYLEEKKE